MQTTNKNKDLQPIIIRNRAISNLCNIIYNTHMQDFKLWTIQKPQCSKKVSTLIATILYTPTLQVSIFSTTVTDKLCFTFAKNAQEFKLMNHI